MSADTPNHDGLHQTAPVGVIPTRSRPAQPSPTRPTPPPEATAPAAADPQEAAEPSRRPSPWRPRFLNRDADEDGAGLAEPGPSGPPRTRTSWGSEAPSPRPKVGQAEMAATLAGVILMLAGFSAWAVSRRGWDLRVPDEVERKAMADPVASILARHTVGDWLDADLLDVTRAGAAVAAYGTSKPLKRPARQQTEAYVADDDLTPEPVGA